MLPVRLFYHVHADGEWIGPVTEFFAALDDNALPGALTVGITGGLAARARVRGAVSLLANGRSVSWTESDEGFEQLTLRAVLKTARWLRTEYAFLYCHAKGALDPSDFNVRWGRSMIRHLVGRWGYCLQLLEDGHDTVGCHWLTPERDHRPPGRPVTTPFYGGNFWWARASYIARLAPCSDADRHAAEAWVGLGSPRAADLAPGWPSTEMFG